MPKKPAFARVKSSIAEFTEATGSPVTTTKTIDIKNDNIGWADARGTAKLAQEDLSQKLDLEGAKGFSIVRELVRHRQNSGPHPLIGKPIRVSSSDMKPIRGTGLISLVAQAPKVLGKLLELRQATKGKKKPTLGQGMRLLLDLPQEEDEVVRHNKQQGTLKEL